MIWSRLWTYGYGSHNGDPAVSLPHAGAEQRITPRQGYCHEVEVASHIPQPDFDPVTVPNHETKKESRADWEPLGSI